MQRIIEKENIDKAQNPKIKAAVYLSCVVSFCAVLVLILVSKHLST